MSISLKRVSLLLTLIFITLLGHAQNTLDNLGLTAATPSAIALSTRLLSTSYTGPAFRIRRSSDNELRDVYFDGSGIISLTSFVSAAGGGAPTGTDLATWIGANSGTVAIWYDQSGNGRDASQATTTRQPRLINAGSLDIKGTRAAVRHLAAGQNFLSVSTAVLSSNFWSINVVESLDGGANQRMLSGQANWLLGFWNGNERSFYFQGGAGGTYSSGVAATTNNQIYSSVGQGASNGLAFRNGGSFSTQAGGVPSNPPTTLLTSSYLTTSEFSNGTIQEITVFANAITPAERQLIECSQSTYYGVAFTAPGITLSAVSPVQVGSATANLPYSATAGAPTTYSVTWDAAAITAGFTNVTGAALPATPIALSIGASATAGSIYTGIFTVSNGCGTSSINYPISVGILNTVLGLAPATSAAYALRRVSPTYSGNAIQVRRSSDNATQNIAFTVGGDLDEVALLTFVGAGNGFVSIWYDQSGFGRNATQATQAAQPRIVNAGVVDKQNGKSAMIFSGGQTLLSSMTAVQGTTSGTISTSNFVFQNNTNNSSLFSNGDGGGNRYNLHVPWGDATTYFDIGAIGSGGRISGPLTWPGFSIGTFRRDGAQGDVWKNGVNSITSGSFSTVVSSTASMWIGSYNGGSNFITGSMAELTVFPSALSTADRTALECNQSAYYTISLAAATNFEFYSEATPAASACNTADEEVVWKNSDLVNTLSSGNNLTKFQSNGNWNGGAASWNQVANNGYLQFRASETNTSRMIGLSTTNIDANFNTIQYAFYMVNNGNLRIYQSGADIGSFGSYATNDVLKISVEASVVKYYRNGTLIYISAVAPTLPLLVDVSINTQGGTIADAIVSNYTTGTFTATAINGGGSPSYQWKLNGVNVGTDTNIYTNTSLNDGDEVKSVLTYTGVCGTTSVTSNTITNRAVAAPTSIDFYIQGIASASACNTVDEEVKWKVSDLVNVQATGNDLLKIQSNGNWNGGAASWNQVANNGYLQFRASETNTSRMIGLSTTNIDANFNTIQYAFYMVNNGNLRIYQSGADIGSFGSYATNDVLKISVEASVVKYYRNGTLIYISAVAPTLPLLVDVSINTQGGTVADAIVSNYNTGMFTATATNAGTPAFQWFVNGSPIVGETTSTYTNTSLADNDVVTATMTPGLGGCSVVPPYTSNTITNRAVAAPTSIDFYIQGIASASACNTVDEEVKWKVSDLVNVQATGNDLLKIQSNGNWNGGAASWNQVANNGYLQFRTSETNTSRMIGLSTTNIDANFNTIQYAFYMVNNGNLRIYQSGTDIGSFGSYATNDVLKISVEASVVKYYRNGTLIYISAVAPTLPLLVDVSINTQGGTVADAIVSNYNTGMFTATATNAGTPAFQWFVNGSPIVGETASTYTNTSLADNDVVTATMTPGLGGCSVVPPYTSNTITNRAVAAPTSIDFYIQGIASASACNTVDEEVKWKVSDLVNVQATGNDLLKIQSNGNWNGGAASWNQVANNGYLQFRASETNTSRMIGLSTTNIDANFNTIQYAFYLVNNGNLRIYQSGTDIGSFGSYATNDVLKISVEASVVKYYRNGTLIYISAVAPTLPLLVDVSINTQGGTVADAVVSNYNTGMFTATATNAGTPAFQWFVNGSPIVGETTSTYTNTSLADNDVVTATMTPGLGGCSVVPPYTSNTITNRAVAAPTSIDFYVAGTISTTACTEAIEQVVWKLSDLVNTQATGNDLLKVQSNGNWNGGAASWNIVNDNGYLQFTASETNTSRMVGLSTTNTDANFNTIQYAFYLVNNGNLRIYQSGTDIGSVGNYASNDILKIAVEANTVKYFRNGVLLYTSVVAPTLPLLADVSINTQGGTVTDALIVNNSNAGTFTATATNAGPTPTYTWQVNGSTVQTGPSNSYTNTSLVPGDVVTSILTPDIGGCSSTNYVSNSITINGPGVTPTNWTGVSDANWYNAANWDNGIPDKFKAAVVNSGTPNNLSLTASANVYDLTIQPGATFTISGTNQLYVFRNFTNYGTFVPNNSRVNFTGCSNASVLSASGTQTFSNVTVNTSFGLTISSGTHQVSNNFTFTNGIVTQNATLLFLASSSTSGANALSYVNGSVRKAGTTAFVFPVGDATRFARIGIGAPSASTTFEAQYFSSPFGIYTNATTPLPVFFNVSAREYWTLNRTTGAGNATVTLYWQDAAFSEIDDCSTADLRVARFNGTSWQNNNNTVTTSGNCTLGTPAGTVSTTTQVSLFGPLTFGSLSGTVNPLPVELTSFTGITENNEVVLRWKTASELNSDYFEIQRLVEGESFGTLGRLQAAGTSNLERDYLFVHRTPSEGKNYYRLKQTDFDGTVEYSNVISVEVGSASTLMEVDVFPNPSVGETINMRISTSVIGEQFFIRLIDVNGKEIIQRNFVDNAYQENIVLEMKHKLAEGIYIIEAGTRLFRKQVRIIISH